jgi:hypothetical protein
MIQLFCKKLTVSLTIYANFFVNFLGGNNTKIITSVPGSTHRTCDNFGNGHFSESKHEANFEASSSLIEFANFSLES